jgi:Ca2+:H+ antiporter
VPEHDPEEGVMPELSVITAILTLAISTVLVALCAEFMVGSINALSETGHISKNFVRLHPGKGTWMQT